MRRLTGSLQNYNSTPMPTNQSSPLANQESPISKPGYQLTKLGWLPEEWEVVKLDSQTENGRKIGYGVVQTGPHIDDGIPCVRVVDLKDGPVSVSEMIRTSNDIDKSYKRTRLRVGDLIIALRGKMGQLKVVDENLAGCNLTRGIALIPLNKKSSNPVFLKMYLSSPKGKINFERRMSGSALKEISIKV